jgi:hypothetical protein
MPPDWPALTNRGSAPDQKAWRLDMHIHRLLLTTAAATGALLVPPERAALILLSDAPLQLHAQAWAGKGDHGGKSGGDRDGKTAGKDDHNHGRAGRARDNRDRADHDGMAGDRPKDRKHTASRTAFHPGNFVRKIDNPNLPLKPGTVFVFRGEDVLGRVRVTNRKLEVAGVKTTVVKDVEFVDGKLAEKTFDYFAQDKAGNVWYFGEDTAEYENGRVVSTEGTWRAGVDGAKPGIVMLADPEVGLTYRQEEAPGVAEDKARVVSLNAKARVPAGRFEGALKTFEFSPLDPELKENKFYASGIGQVLTIDRLTGEREELLRVKRR